MIASNSEAVKKGSTDETRMISWTFTSPVDHSMNNPTSVGVGGVATLLTEWSGSQQAPHIVAPGALNSCAAPRTVGKLREAASKEERVMASASDAGGETGAATGVARTTVVSKGVPTDVAVPMDDAPLWSPAGVL